jgi:hypothetical protein
LAYPIQRLTVAALALTAAPVVSAEKAFSHRVHLRIQPDCASCHAAARSSKAPADNLLPSPAACKPCHDEVSIQEPATVLLKSFNHALHLKLGNVAPVLAAAIDAGNYLSKPPPDLRRQLTTTNACVACHRGLEESDAVSKTAFPLMADCLVCHSKIDPPFSCEKCHEPGPQLKPDDHTPDFLDTHSSGKLKLDKPSCAVCHGRKFTCLGCH